MKNICYYHIYLSDDIGFWSSIFLEQMKLLEDSKLLSYLTKLNIVCISNSSQKTAILKSLCETEWHTPSSVDIVIDEVVSSAKDDAEMFQRLNQEDYQLTENITYRKMYNDCHNQGWTDTKILYIHSKGVTSLKLLMEGNAQGFKNYQYWRHFLNWGVIQNWRKCVELLGTNDVVGVNFQDDPEPHYSGGMWWANCEHIASLPDPATKKWWIALQNRTTDNWLRTCSDRFRDEMWVCSNYTLDDFYRYGRPCKGYYDLIDLPSNHNPARKYLSGAAYFKEV